MKRARASISPNGSYVNMIVESISSHILPFKFVSEDRQVLRSLLKICEEKKTDKFTYSFIYSMKFDLVGML